MDAAHSICSVCLLYKVRIWFPSSQKEVGGFWHVFKGAQV
jgi:hypothetical protein